MTWLKGQGHLFTSKFHILKRIQYTHRRISLSSFLVVVIIVVVGGGGGGGIAVVVVVVVAVAVTVFAAVDFAVGLKSDVQNINQTPCRSSCTTAASRKRIESIVGFCCCCS